MQIFPSGFDEQAGFFISAQVQSPSSGLIRRKKIKNRRGRGFSKKCVKSLKIIGNNSAGIKAKSDSLQNVLHQLNPGVVLIQESKLYQKGTLKFDDYCVFERIRNQHQFLICQSN